MLLVKEVVDAFVLALRADGRADNTIKFYSSSLRPFVNYCPGSIEEVSRHDLRQYVVYLREQNFAPTTIAGRVCAVKTLLNWAEREGYLRDNPADAIKTPTPGQKIPRAIEQATLDALMKAAPHPRDLALLCFLVQTGCRACEVKRMQWRDIDLDERSAVVIGKGDKSRFVLFGTETQEALRLWKRFHPGTETVFCNIKNGKALTHWGIHNIIARLKERAGVDGKRCNLHSFRHFFATTYLENGGDLASLKEIMGHENISTTEKAYVFFTKQSLQKKYDQHAPSVALGLD